MHQAEASPPLEGSGKGGVALLGRVCPCVDDASVKAHDQDETEEKGGATAHHIPGATRLARLSLQLVDEKIAALEHNTLVPPPEPKQGTKPLKAMIKGLWVLAIIGGIVGIIVAASSRIHAPEPLEHVHATTGDVPYVMNLNYNNLDYLFVNLVIAPFTPPDGSATSGGSHRRRLLAHLAGPEAPRVASSSMRLGEADEEETLSSMRKLLVNPKRVLSRRRSLLSTSSLPEPANEATDVVLPELKVTVMQRNTSVTVDLSTNDTCAVLNTQIAAFYPVSESQFCVTKENSAVRCNMNFRTGDLTNALATGQNLYLGFQSTQPVQIVFAVEASDIGGLGPVKNYLSLAILLLVLLAIASERIHRMWCAMIGAGFMMSILLWMNMAPTLALVVEWIDESTLGLLFGMMIIVGRLKDTGMFEVLSAAAVRLSRGKMWALSTMLMVSTGFISAWLDNVTTMLLMAPVSISMMRQMNQDPVPLLMAQVLMSNIGGAATMVGDPPALIIGTALSYTLGFIDFIVNMAPGVLMASVVVIPLILWIYRRTLMPAIQNYDALVESAKGFRITDWDLFAKCAYVTAAVVIGFLLHPVHHVDPAWFALFGAIVLCVCTEPMNVEHVLHVVEWDMLLFFAGMFVMVEAAVEIGTISMIGGWLESWIRAVPDESRLIVAIQILLWVVAVASAVLDNIPLTVTMVPVIEYLAAANLGLDLSTLAWALNFGACFGGNGSLIGASANIVTATLAERSGEKISFVTWLKSGVPVTIVSVAIADVWLILRFCL